MHVLSFTERAKTLENAFFQRVDEQLLGNIRSSLTEHDAITALRVVSGIANDELLAELVKIEVQPETLAAVTLIPLVAVAWADGTVTDAERRKILAAEQEAGIDEAAPGHQLLNHWLDHNPGEDLFTTWKHYVVALRGRLTPALNSRLDKDLIERATAVAKASGGYLTYGSISPKEKKVLEELKQTLRIAHPK